MGIKVEKEKNEIVEKLGYTNLLERFLCPCFSTIVGC